MIVFVVWSISGVVIHSKINPPFTLLMFSRVFEQIGDGKDIKLKHDWVSIDDISPNLVQAVVTSEDNHFMEHFGVDWKAIQMAMRHNQNHSRIKGGSTISQQTAKNVYLWQSRTYVRKAFELYYTTLMEVFWTKERIMEMYLNMIEMGDGIYGAEMAAKEYFKKPAKKLSKSESALIAASLPNPRKRNPARPSNYMVGRKILILQGMKRTGIVKLSEEPKKEEDQKNEKSEN
jgi:monofunctional biosynthetic peptidoglycan transglycosylase